MMILVINSYAYNYLIKYQNDRINKYYFNNLNDCLGFTFSDFFDDLRSGSLIFIYESKYNFIINAESHMLTFRGYKDTPEELRKRIDLFEIDFMYYFSYLIRSETQYFGNIDIGIGLKNLLYGNWGGTLAQKAVHFVLKQLRPIPKNYDNYNYRGFLSAAINYSYMKFLNIENYIDLSYFADYFFKTSIAINFRNESIGLEAQIFYQTQSNINNIETYSKIQEAETGIGIQYRLHSKNFFTINNLIIKNFSNKEQFFSVGGFGIIFTEEYESMSEDSLYTLNQNFSLGYDIMSPLQTRNSIYYKIINQLKYYFSIATNYDTNLDQINNRTNRFSSGIIYKLFKKDRLVLYISFGITLSHNRDNKDTKAIYRPIKIKDTIQTGFEIETGISIKTIRYNKIMYDIKIFTKTIYSPIVYNIRNNTLETHRLIPNYFGIGIEITP